MVDNGAEGVLDELRRDDLENPNEVVAFDDSRGDPDGRLVRKLKSARSDWWAHKALLGVAASLWEETDERA